MSQQQQNVPVRLYQTENQLMVAVPVPGLEPQNISVSIDGNRVTIRGEERGPRQHERDLLLAEWTIGPYHRGLELPQPVNGALTNATYGNGVLVLSMPKMAQGQQGVSAEFLLEAIEATRGERVGHSGRDQHETTTAEHRQRMVDSARRAGGV
jgi:HSP20 family protein